VVNRPCLDCGTLTPKTRCPSCSSAHNRERDQRRGSATERGYGHAYRVRRAQALEGATHCRTCGQPFSESNPATGGHVVPLRSLPRHERRASAATAQVVPECQACNYGNRVNL
jgi:hypothetical protein